MRHHRVRHLEKAFMNELNDLRSSAVMSASHKPGTAAALHTNARACLDRRPRPCLLRGSLSGATVLGDALGDSHSAQPTLEALQHGHDCPQHDNVSHEPPGSSEHVPGGGGGHAQLRCAPGGAAHATAAAPSNMCAAPRPPKAADVRLRRTGRTVTLRGVPTAPATKRCHM